MKGEDVENLLRARGEFRPHPEFGVNLHVPWSAGTQASQPLASGWVSYFSLFSLHTGAPKAERQCRVRSPVGYALTPHDSPRVGPESMLTRLLIKFS